MPPAVPVTMLPQWTLKTSYGQQHIHEYRGKAVNPIVLSALPAQQYGDVEISQSPLLSRPTKTPQIYNAQDIASEMPSRIVPCESMVTCPVALVAADSDVFEPVNAGWSTAIGNRHIPPDLPYYYFECEIGNDSDIRLGFVEFGVKHGAHGQPATAFSPPSQESKVKELVPEEFSGATVSELKRIVDVLSQPGRVDLIAALAGATDGALNGGVKSTDISEHYFDTEYVFSSLLEPESPTGSIDDSSSDDESILEVSEPAAGPVSSARDAEMLDFGGESLLSLTQEDLSDQDDEDDDNSASPLSASSDQSLDEESADDGHNHSFEDNEENNSDSQVDPLSPQRVPLSSRHWVTVFGDSDVIYDRRPACAVNSVYLVPASSTVRARAILWDVSHFRVYTNTRDHPVSMVPEAKRVGIVMNRLQNTIHLTCDGAQLPNSVPANLSTASGKEWFPVVMLRSGRAKARFGDGLQVNDSFMFDMAAFIDQTRTVALTNRSENLATGRATNCATDTPADVSEHTEYFTVGLQTEPKGPSPEVDAAVNEYLEYYGYALAPKDPYESSRAKHVRHCVATGRFAKIAEMFASNLTPNALFLLCLHQFVALARRAECRRSALALGRTLSNLQLPDHHRDQLNSAAAILVTSDPRAPELAYWYSPECHTELIREILNMRRNVPVPKLQTYVKSLLDPGKIDDRRAQEQLATLRTLSGGTLYKW